jgi:hypothetical protein
LKIHVCPSTLEDARTNDARCAPWLTLGTDRERAISSGR